MKKWNWNASRLFVACLCTITAAAVITAAVLWYRVDNLQREAQRLRDESTHGAVLRSGLDVCRKRAETLTMYARYLECEAQPWGAKPTYASCRKG